MTHLGDAFDLLGLNGKIELADRWLQVQGEHCTVYVVEQRGGVGYFTWCDHPQARTIEFYRDPATAINAGLQRARQVTQPNAGENTPR